MLKREENELVTRVGPGTPMGNTMRRYWMPALLSEELPHPDSDPVRVRLLGEQLIGFRDSNGRVGLIQNNCPHRGASLFFGRNEEAGIRCVYHGWKFDVEGRCIDMPNEPAESDFKAKVKAVAYPCQERGGLEAEEQIPGSFSEYQLRVKTAHFEVIDTEGGAAYGARRPAGPDQVYWRIAQWCFPFYTFTPPGVLGTKKGGNARVPMDDTHSMVFSMVGRRRANTGPGTGAGAPTPFA